MHRPHKPPVRVFRVLALFLATVVAYGLGEIAARVWYATRPVVGLRGLHVYQPDLPWLYGLRPGAEGRLTAPGRSQARYRINEDGFRGPRYARPKPANRFRVVVMGDSVAFGYDVEEREAFPRVLEQTTALEAPEARVEVVNLGVGGYNPWNEAKLFAGVGIGYQPDLVLVQFCVNDLNDPTIHFDGQTRLALSAIPDEAFPDPSRRLRRKAPSRLDRLCLRSGLCTMAREVWLRRIASTWSDDEELFAFEPITSKDGPEWPWLERNYMEMAAAAGRGGARFAVLMIPHRGQVEDETHKPDSVREQLQAIAARHGWTLVDPLDAFRAARRDGVALFLDQWHPTAAGHRLIAEATQRALACAGDLGDKGRTACPTK